MSVAESTLGSHGPRASRVGLGLAALGRPGYINLGRAEDLGADRSPAVLQRRAEEVLDAAYAAGVRYFDLARSYGESERFLAEWLASRGLRPGEVTVGSKWGYTYTAGWRVEAERHEVKELSAANLRRQLAESRELLGEHLALYQIHSATLGSGVLADAGVRAEMLELQAGGVAIGLSVTGPGQAATIDAALAAGSFDVVQATWNLLEPAAGESLARARAAGLGVIVKEPLANGRLSVRGASAAPAALAAEAGWPPEQLAFAAALARPWADVVLSGAVTTAQLAANLAAAELAWDEELERAAVALAVPSEDYWAERSALPWN